MSVHERAGILNGGDLKKQEKRRNCSFKGGLSLFSSGDGSLDVVECVGGSVFKMYWND